jgi:hypothetical protein
MNLGKAAVIKQKQNVVSSPPPCECDGGVAMQYMRWVRFSLEFGFQLSALRLAFDSVPVTIPIICLGHRRIISKHLMTAIWRLLALVLGEWWKLRCLSQGPIFSPRRVLPTGPAERPCSLDAGLNVG